MATGPSQSTTSLSSVGVNKWNTSESGLSAINAHQGEAIARAKTRLMYQHSRLPLWINLLLGACVAWTFKDQAPLSWVAGWFACLSLVILGRIWLQRRFRQLGMNAVDAGSWQFRYLVGATINGIVWGVLGYACLWVQGIEYHALLAFVLCAMAITAVPLLSTTQFGYALYLFVVLGPITGFVFMLGDQLHLLMGITTIVIACSLFIIARHFRSSIERAYHATHDTLTDLVNRTEFERRLYRAHDNAVTSQTAHALCFLDLDQFKLNNDSCGHLAGDEMLREISKVLARRIRARDTLARMGDDEFAIILENCPLEKAVEVAQSIRHAIEHYRFNCDDRDYSVNASIGIVAISDVYGTPIEVMRAADAALYTAKDVGRSSIHVSEEDDTAVEERRRQMNWAGKITEALDKNRFTIFAQPIQSVKRNGEHNDYCEVLLRLTDDDQQIIAAGEFMSAAENYGLMPMIDRWVIRRSFAWLAEDSRGTVRRCAINLSGASLGSEGFAKFVHEQMASYQVDPKRLIFEITESSLIENIESARDFIEEFHALGCRFALDDFGKGLSSFGYLKNLPVDILKIDGMFVKDMAADSVDNTMVRAINDIGHALGKETVAEFVEHEQTLQLLEEIGVDYAQGYALGRPSPITDRQRYGLQY